MSHLAIARRVPVLCIAGTFACALARPERVYLERVVSPDPLTTRLHRTMEQFAVEGFTGTVLIARGSRVLLYQGYGHANRARHLPNTAETRYPFGALANQLTATGILQLEADGRLGLEQPVANWLGADAGDATLAELLTRSAEAAGGRTSIRPAGSPGPLEELAVERFRSAGPSYALLEQVLAAASGRSLRDVQRERLIATGPDVSHRL